MSWGASRTNKAALRFRDYFHFRTLTPFSHSHPQALFVYLHLAHNLYLPVHAMDYPETTQAAANMPSNPTNQSPSPVGAEDGEQQITIAASDNNGDHAVSHSNSTTHSLPSEASSASQTATGDKRKRGDDAGELGTKRQMIALPLRGRPAVAPPSYQNQQALIGSEAQTSRAELSKSHEPSPSPTENQGMSEMQLDATEGQKFLGAKFAVVSMNRLLRQRWELYEDWRGQYRRRCQVVEMFKTGWKSWRRRSLVGTLTSSI